MNKVMIWDEETRNITIKGNERWGSDVRVKAPYEQVTYNEFDTEPLERTWEDRENFRDEWHIEKEYLVKSKVWKEIVFYGAALEYSDENLYAHKDVLQRGLNERELNFLNSYRNRFLLITNGEEDMIYDNKNKKLFKTNTKNIQTFKEFKETLKELNLI